MVDHQCRRAPNATFGSIDGKVKLIKNGIATWLDDQPEEEQKKVLDFVVRRGRDMRALHKKREGDIMEALSVRQRQKEQRRDKAKRNMLQKKVKEVLAGTLPLEEMSEAEMTEDMTDTITALITNPVGFVGKYLDHIWDIDRVDVTFHGKVVRLKYTKAKGQAFQITYWRDDESEIDGEDEIVLLVEFIVDIIFRDLWLLL